MSVTLEEVNKFILVDSSFLFADIDEDGAIAIKALAEGKEAKEELRRAKLALANMSKKKGKIYK